ncbi:MAG: hypothetical protein QOG67_286 [Verrucomicrobiota bacterium]|jgi:uncharacterized protein YndB with AHSA1/START domain
MTTKHNLAEAVVIERTFNAPIGRVWDALTEVEKMRCWYFDLKEFEPKVGFKFEFTFEHEGMTYHHLCQVTEAIPPEKLAYTWKYDGYQGDSLVTFELSEDGDKTRLKLTHEGLETFPKLPSFARENFEAGWASIASELKQFVEKRAADREFVISRTFDAPRELVWKAWTERERLMQWFGPKGFTMPVAKLDFRPGGTLHYCLRSPDGKDMWGKFVYREIVPMERIVLVNSFSDEKGNLTRHPLSPAWPLEMLTDTAFTEENGKTTVTLRWRPLNATPEERITFDGAHDGMRQGWTGTFDQLTEYLKNN